MAKQTTRKTTISNNPVTLGKIADSNGPIREYKPTVEEVRRRAHELYLGRVASGKPGTQEGDWLAAERELSGRARR